MRVRPRKRRIPTTNKPKAIGKGPIRIDAVSGWPFPKREMVRQRGRLVSGKWRDGSLDLPDKSP